MKTELRYIAGGLVMGLQHIALVVECLQKKPSKILVFIEMPLCISARLSKLHAIVISIQLDVKDLETENA